MATAKNKKPRSAEKESGFGVADSIAHAVGILRANGIEASVAQLKKAKKAGCRAFRSNRVYLDELIVWLKENADELDDDEKEALECRRILAQCEKLEFQNLVERGHYTHNDILTAQGIRIGHATRTALLRLKADAPTWEGLAAADIDARVDKLVESICRDLHEATSKLYAGSR